MTISFDSLPLCVRTECFRYLSIHDLGTLGATSREMYRETVYDDIWRELYPSTFTRAKEAIPEDIQNLVNRPYRRSCIGWSVSVLQTGSADTWLTGTVMDYRNEMFLVRYDLNESEVWERETITSGPWFTAGKLRVRFLSAAHSDFEKRASRAPSIDESDLQAEPLLQPKQRKRKLEVSNDSISCDSTTESLVASPVSSTSTPRVCIDDESGSHHSSCGRSRHSWRCESFRDRTQAPTKLAGELRAHTDEVLSVAFSNGGDRLASCSRDGTTRIHSVTDVLLESVVVIQHERGDVPCRVVWSPDDSMLLACTEAKNGNIFDYDAHVACYDTQTGARLFTKPNIPFDVCAQWIPHSCVFIHGETLTISPRGTYHQTLALVDASSDRVVGRFHFRFISEAFIHLIQVSPDGNFLAVTCGIGDALSDTVRVVRIPPLRSSSNNFLSSSFEIRVPRAKFDARTLIANSPLRNLNHSAAGLLASTPVSKLLSVASPCGDGDPGVPSFYCAGAVLGLAWSRDSRTFYTNTRVYVHPSSSLENLSDRPDLDNTLEIQVWSIDSSATDPVARMKGAHGFTTKDCPFYLFLAESPCGEYVASGSEDCGVYVYHVRHGRLLRVLWNGHSDVVSMVSWQPKGDHCLLASASDDHKICLWSSSVAEEFMTMSSKRAKLTS